LDLEFYYIVDVEALVPRFY